LGHSESQGMGGSSNGYLKPRLGLVIFFKNSDIFVDIYRRRHEGNVTNNQLGLDEEKTKIRGVLLPIFFPELTGEEGRVLLTGLCENINMTMMEACYCIVVMSKALRENRTMVGEDRGELRKIIQFYLERIVQLVNGKTAVGRVEH